MRKEFRNCLVRVFCHYARIAYKKVMELEDVVSITMKKSLTILKALNVASIVFFTHPPTPKAHFLNLNNLFNHAFKDSL